jgi:hypothetical protein
MTRNMVWVQARQADASSFDTYCTSGVDNLARQVTVRCFNDAGAAEPSDFFLYVYDPEEGPLQIEPQFVIKLDGRPRLRAMDPYAAPGGIRKAVL